MVKIIDNYKKEKKELKEMDKKLKALEKQIKETNIRHEELIKKYEKLEKKQKKERKIQRRKENKKTGKTLTKFRNVVKSIEKKNNIKYDNEAKTAIYDREKQTRGKRLKELVEKFEKIPQQLKEGRFEHKAHYWGLRAKSNILKKKNPLLKDLENYYELRSIYNNLVLQYVFIEKIKFNVNEDWIKKRGTRTLQDVYSLFKFKNDIKIIIIDYLTKYKGMKFNISLECEFIKITTKKNKIGEKRDKALIGSEYNMYFASRNTVILNEIDIDNKIEKHIFEIIDKINEHEGRGSGGVIKSISNFSINNFKYNPTGGEKYIALDPHTANKKCCVNIKNEDEECFKYCALYHENKDKIKIHPERVSNYKNIKTNLKFNGLEFPLILEDIDKFEKMNNISVHVYEKKYKKSYLLKRITFNYTKYPANYKEIKDMSIRELIEIDYLYSKNKDYIIPLDIFTRRISENYNEKNHMNLLLLIEENKETGDHNTHY